MRHIRILPFAVDERKNCSGWRQSGQLLASVLFWAQDAGASTIEFDPMLNEPFVYRSDTREVDETEMGPTPKDKIAMLPQLIRDVVDGHPLLRPIRRAIRLLFRLPYEAILEVPGCSESSDSSWHVKILGDQATFTRTDSVA